MFPRTTIYACNFRFYINPLQGPLERCSASKSPEPAENHDLPNLLTSLLYDQCRRQVLLTCGYSIAEQFGGLHVVDGDSCIRLSKSSTPTLSASTAMLTSTCRLASSSPTSELIRGACFPSSSNRAKLIRKDLALNRVMAAVKAKKGFEAEGNSYAAIPVPAPSHESQPPHAEQIHESSSSPATPSPEIWSGV